VPGSSTCIDIGAQSVSSVLAIGLKPDSTASTLLLDLQRFTSESIAIAKIISTNRDQTRAILLTLERLRSVLSTLLTPGLNEGIDGICFARLGVKLAPKPIGFARYARSFRAKNVAHIGTSVVVLLCCTTAAALEILGASQATCLPPMPCQ
jgi:hypothetical protein